MTGPTARSGRQIGPLVKEHSSFLEKRIDEPAAIMSRFAPRTNEWEGYLLSHSPSSQKIYRKEHTTMKKIVKQINAGDRSKLGNIYW
jgi:hypothetical protein